MNHPKEVRISLVFPRNVRKISPQPYYRENLGIQYLASLLQQKGYTVQVLVADGGEATDDEVLDRIKQTAPHLVGISPSVDTAKLTINICRTLRQILPSDSRLCLGGQHATYFADDILRGEPSIDFIVLGEGEDTIVRIAESLLKNSEIVSTCGGIALRQGSAIASSHKVLLENGLDNYPDPDRSTLSEIVAGGGYAMPLILTSRGCPYGCSFCSSPDFFQGVWRTRSASRVVDEIENIINEFNLTHFYFTDDQILGRGAKDKWHLMGIVDEILSRELDSKYDLYFFVMMRANFYKVLNHEELARFRRAGFKDIFIGFESGSEESLKIYRKGLKRTSYDEVFQLRDRFFIEGGFILFTPFTTKDSLLADANLIRTQGIPIWNYYARKLIPYPGTNLFLQFRQRELFEACNYEEIRFRFIDQEVVEIYNIVHELENSLRPIDDVVFRMVDAYQKARLSRRGANSQWSVGTLELDRTFKDLAEQYHALFEEAVALRTDRTSSREILDRVLRHYDLVRSRYQGCVSRNLVDPVL